jgi:hypothetical protein
MSEPCEICGLFFPARVGPFLRGQVIDNTAVDPRQGHTIAYHLAQPRAPDDAAKVTVYIYPEPALPEPPPGGIDAVLADEARFNSAGLREAVDLGLFTSIEFLNYNRVVLGERTTLLLLEFVTTAGEAPETLFGYIALVWWSGRFVKVRISAASQQVGRMHAVGFSSTLAVELGIAPGARRLH